MGTLSKINNAGQYTPYPGVTIIAPVRIEDASFWERVHQCLVNNSLASKYYSFTPVSSYHMTGINLYTEHDIGSEWRHFIETRLAMFMLLNDELKKNNHGVEAEVTLVWVDDTIALLVVLKTEDRITFSSLAKNFDVDAGLPHIYHITLGHCYQPVPKDLAPKLRAQLNEQLISLFSNEGYVRLQAPVLCSFENMTAFTPWDGKTYPFSKTSNKSPLIQRSLLNNPTNIIEARHEQSASEEIQANSKL